MKTFKSMPGAVLLFSVMMSCSRGMSPQNTAKARDMAEMVRSKEYVFKAQTVLPMRGGARHLTSAYDVSVRKDTVVSYLPYFGRAYRAPIDPSKGGIQFTSTDFEYTVKEDDKGGWNVVIQPRDVDDVRQLSFSIFENGHASLQVTSNSRQPISFNGIVEALEGQD